jgi:putative sigma-54 modulation protein
MIPSLPIHASAKLIVRGIHVELTDAMKAAIVARAERLFRHEPHILMLRVDVERDHKRRGRMFVAKGKVEIAGPDITASTASGDAYLAIGLLIDKLDRMLRKRATALRRKRHAGDIREHSTNEVLV